MRVGCNNYGLGTWFQLRRICSVMMFPEHPMTCTDRVYMIVWEVLCRAQLRIRGPKLVLYEDSFKKGLGRWGHSIGPEPRAHMGLGISVPYSVYRALKSCFSLWLNSSSIDRVSIEVYEFPIFCSVFHPIRGYVFALSFLTTLNIYKDYFKGRKRLCTITQ